MLDARDIDRLADAIAPRVAALLADHREETPAFPHHGLVPVADVCEFLGMQRSWVYDNQARLGARKLGGAIRFDAQAVRRFEADRAVRAAADPKDEVARRRANGRANRRRRAASFDLIELPEDAA